MIHSKQTLNCRGQLVSLEKPIVMGILNVTPDSFYDGGRHTQLFSQLRQTEKMLKEGATIIDIGGMSSRPGAEIISEDVELKRVLPIISAIQEEFPKAIVSIDTVRGKVAEEAVNSGASIVNDISAGKMDESMYPTVSRLGVPYILMHMQGKPASMQNEPIYTDVVKDVLDFLIEEVGKLRTLNVKDIIIDPGFGFGKTVEHNYALLKKMHVFQMLDCPLLAGVSRKSMIYKVLETSAKEALNGTTALHMVALQQGAKILRVHDVKPAIETVRLWEQLEEIG